MGEEKGSGRRRRRVGGREEVRSRWRGTRGRTLGGRRGGGRGRPVGGKTERLGTEGGKRRRALHASGDRGMTVLPPFRTRTRTPSSSVCRRSSEVSDTPPKRPPPSDWLTDRRPEEGHISARFWNRQGFEATNGEECDSIPDRAMIVREVGVGWERDNRG